ncbi:MAG: TIGR04282 family arsenosugar biosynthesis glycosyltransferase [Burkholderiales bacterium]|nr:TIGR04282 family arsenosugar biosynthesis glycosyltransferase [Burkholderiales bacterium]
MTGVEVAVFARAPVAGQAKTRLIPLLGAAGAAHLQARLLAAAVAKAGALPGAACSLWVAGDANHPAIIAAATRHRVPIEAQVGDDLGQRMHGAMVAALSRHARCLIIGTDCPALTTAHLAEAAAALQSHDVVLGPAEDGGYVLIGLARPRPNLFEGIAWGSSTVLAATRQRIRDAALRLHELPALPDLDTPDDYRHAQAQGWLPT